MKTFFLMLGSALMGVVIFVAAFYGYFYWQHMSGGPGTALRMPARGERTVDAAPPVKDLERFYGTHGSTMGNFPDEARRTVLAPGPGRIAGRVTSDGKPLQGLRLRLALNGAVMSQWATSDAGGSYEVPLPYGKYRVDGYMLDSDSANAVLAGKIDGPRQGPFGQELTDVAEGRPGQGLDLAYVDPVRKLGPKGEVSQARPVTLSWEPYPSAVSYRLQLIEQRDREDYESERRLFDWRDRPIVRQASIDLAEYKVELKKGYYYTLEVEALGERNRPISQSPRGYGRPDFRVVD